MPFLGVRVGMPMLSGPVSAAPDAAQTTAFLARANAVTTLDATHTNAYRALINGLVNTTATEGGTLFARFDILMSFATESSGVALLNLVNSTYAATNNGTTFTADRGFAGTGGTAYVATNFNPSTATSPNYTQNSAHLSVWSLNAAQSTAASISIQSAGGESNIFTEFTDGNSYLRVNDSAQTGGFTSSSLTGLFLGNRDSSTTRQGYHNGTSVGTYGSSASAALVNNVVAAVSTSNNTTPSSNKVAAISAGSSLSATDQLNFYNLVRAYMTAVGVS